MANTLFIGEQYLKDHSVISANVDIKLIVPNIEFSQDTEVQSVLGTALYNQLQTSFSGGTLAGDEYTLMELIKPWLCALSTANAIPFLAIQLRAKGANQISSDYAQPADTIDVKYLRQLLLDRSESYKALVENYLCTNGHLFPAYVSTSNQLVNPSHESAYDCDFYLGDVCSHCGGFGCNCYKWH